MRPQVLLVLVASALSAVATTAPALAPMTATIDALQETPPNGSPGTGVGRFLVDTSANTMFIYVSFSGLTAAETAAHIHGYAPPGTPAGVVFALPAGSPKIAAWNYPDANEAQILSGLTYVNIHTTAFPGGEIRGQIIADTATNMVALVNAAQEVPPNASPGQGIGFFKIDTAANTLNYDIRYGLLSAAETAAHIHGFAPPGTPAGVLVALPAGNPKVGVWNYLEAQETGILGEMTYVNIHTTAFPGGEIRGQIINPSPATGVPELKSESAALSLVAAPNPVRASGGSVALFYRAPGAGDVTVTIHDVTGRTVRTVHSGHAAETGIFAWDTRNDNGAPVAAGVYFARIAAAGRSETQPITVLK